MQPISPLNKRNTRRRRRRLLAVIGLILILVSILLLFSIQGTPPREQLRYDPPATLFAPPEVDS